jgi:hypothetical protein
MSQIIELPIASAISEPIDPSAEGLRAWIWETCRYLGISPTEFAREAKLASSTINRFMRAEAGSDASLSGRTIEALLNAARSIDAYQAENEPQHPTTGERNDQLEKPYLTSVAVIGRARAEPISTTDPIIYSPPLYWLKLPISREYLNKGLGAFEIVDDHALPTYPPGSIVIVSPLRSKIQRHPERGIVVDLGVDDQEDIISLAVLGQDTESGKTLYRASVKKFAISPGGDAWLLTPNRQAHSLKDEPVTHHHSLGYRIIGSYRPVMRKKALD